MSNEPRDGFCENDDIFPVSQRGKIFQRKQDDSKTCSRCIVVEAPYPSSLGGVYQPEGTERQTQLFKEALLKWNSLTVHIVHEHTKA